MLKKWIVKCFVLDVDIYKCKHKNCKTVKRIFKYKNIKVKFKNLKYITKVWLFRFFVLSL